MAVSKHRHRHTIEIWFTNDNLIIMNKNACSAISPVLLLTMSTYWPEKESRWLAHNQFRVNLCELDPVPLALADTNSRFYRMERPCYWDLTHNSNWKLKTDVKTTVGRSILVKFNDFSSHRSLHCTWKTIDWKRTENLWCVRVHVWTSFAVPLLLCLRCFTSASPRHYFVIVLLDFHRMMIHS